MPKPITSVIILAAGASSRLGRPKQLVIYKNMTLLQHAVEAAAGVTDTPVIVVTGAHQELIEQKLAGSAVNCVYNANWQQGMGSSIVAGIKALPPHTDQVIVMLCDQPFADTALLQNFLQQQALTGKPIIASSYAGTVGVPALLHRSIFAELLDLRGQEGAKKVIIMDQDRLATVPFEKGTIDIDTTDDVTSLDQGIDQ